MNHTLQLRRVLLLLGVLFLFLALAGNAAAHPLGNFTINHYARLEAARGSIRVRFVLDYAEIPTFQEKQAMDTDGDGTIAEPERAAYLARQVPQLTGNLNLTVNNQRVALLPEPGSVELSFFPGQGGLEVMRLAMWLSAPFGSDLGKYQAQFTDENYSTRLGWRELVTVGAAGVGVDGVQGAGADSSRELTAYPADMLDHPRDDRTVRFAVVPGKASSSPSTQAEAVAASPLAAFDRTRDEFAKLVATTEELSPTVLLVSLLAAMALGALHAFSPGHGKAVVGAYLVGSRGNWQHALLLGFIITATHTAGVYALGLVTLFLSAFILPEQLLPWLAFVSGLLVAIIGLRLLVTRFQAARAHNSSFDRALNGLTEVGRTSPALAMQPAYASAFTHTHADGSVHSHHTHDDHDGAVHHSHSHHTHDDHDGGAHHSHSHDASQHSHSHALMTPEQELAHAQAHAVEIEMMTKPTWKSIVSLGVSGGLLPCPSALVVMLSAIALGRIWYGLYLILGFSLGLASVLVVTGLVLLYAGKLAGRYMRGPRAGMFFRFVPLAGALVVMLLGIGIAVDAIAQTGLLR